MINIAQRGANVASLRSLLRPSAYSSAPITAVASTSSPSTSRTFLSATVPRRAQNAGEKDPQLGDYPDVIPRNRQLRRYDKNWFDPQEKRNFGEPLHEQDDILAVMTPDLHAGVNPGMAARHLGLAMLSFAGFFALIYYITPEKPFIPRTFPRNGLEGEMGGKGLLAPREEDFEGQEEGEEEDDE
ncbi:unnamed protein product [Jaminaea pallidilutea]